MTLHSLRRKITDKCMRWLFQGMAFLLMIPLVSLVIYVASKGFKRLDMAFFTHLPAPVGEPGGGMANAILGSLTLMGIACAVSLPISLLAGIYLAEHGRNGKLAPWVRFTTEVLSGVPSIVTGIFVYHIMVRPLHHFSAIAGGVALGFLMIPLVTRTTEELLKLVPDSLREGSLALGIPQWRTTLRVTLHAARGGIITGILLAVARISGETAPLLFTALNNQFWNSGLNQPTASLPVQVYTYAISPFQDWQDQAWTGALVLLLLVGVISLAAKLAVGKMTAQSH